jgi:putative transposase
MLAAEIQWLGQAMLKMKGIRFPKKIILLCIRWYAAYPLSYRNLEEMIQERGVYFDRSSVSN